MGRGVARAFLMLSQASGCRFTPRAWFECEGRAHRIGVGSSKWTAWTTRTSIVVRHAAHEDSADLHDMAAELWEERGDAERAELERRSARLERDAAEIARDWAALEDELVELSLDGEEEKLLVANEPIEVGDALAFDNELWLVLREADAHGDLRSRARFESRRALVLRDHAAELLAHAKMLQLKVTEVREARIRCRCGVVSRRDVTRRRCQHEDSSTVEELHRRNKRYLHGVGRVGAHDRTSGEPVTNFTHSNYLYRLAMRYTAGSIGTGTGSHARRSDLAPLSGGKIWRA